MHLLEARVMLAKQISTLYCLKMEIEEVPITIDPLLYQHSLEIPTKR